MAESMMNIPCDHCQGKGYIPLGDNASVCPECHEAGYRFVAVKAPFSVDAMRGNDETDTDVQVRMIDRHIPTPTIAIATADVKARSCDESFDGWDFVVSDANGERIHRVKAEPVAV